MKGCYSYSIFILYDILIYVKNHLNFKHISLSFMEMLCVVSIFRSVCWSDYVCVLIRDVAGVMLEQAYMYGVFWFEQVLEVKLTVWQINCFKINCLVCNADCMESFEKVASVLISEC